jgi:hypothetical protein
MKNGIRREVERYDVFVNSDRRTFRDLETAATFTRSNVCLFHTAEP